eukprot:1161351-Pelagomonas_calceolata.AAC.2
MLSWLCKGLRSIMSNPSGPKLQPRAPEGRRTLSDSPESLRGGQWLGTRELPSELARSRHQCSLAGAIRVQPLPIKLPSRELLCLHDYYLQQAAEWDKQQRVRLKLEGRQRVAAYLQAPFLLERDGEMVEG